MSRLYIAPIGSNGDWVERFEETVATPVTLLPKRVERTLSERHETVTFCMIRRSVSVATAE